MYSVMEKNLFSIIDNIRKVKPLVYQITNNVTVNDCANATLAIGASPVMGEETEETEDLVSIADALVLNIGTITRQSERTMKSAAEFAKRKGIPIILDPVGAGASKLRTDISLNFINNFHPVVKCNYSEFLAVAGLDAGTHGVDSVHTVPADPGIIEGFARNFGLLVIVTGKNDIISNGTQTIVIHNGDPRMELVTGTGCMCGALVGAALASVNGNDYFTAACAAISLMSVCGEIAGKNYKGTTSYRNDIIDRISTMTEKEFLDTIKISHT